MIIADIPNGLVGTDFSVVMVALGFFRKLESVKEAKSGYISGRHPNREASKSERRKAEAFWGRERRRRKQKEDEDDDIPY